MVEGRTPGIAGLSKTFPVTARTNPFGLDEVAFRPYGDAAVAVCRQSAEDMYEDGGKLAFTSGTHGSTDFVV